MGLLTIFRQLHAWLYARYVAPARLTKRRAQRLVIHKISDVGHIATASLHLDHNLSSERLSCSAFVVRYATHYQGKQQASAVPESPDSKFMPLLTALDLRQYATHQDYLRAIRKHSGYFLRNVKKANREGFSVRSFVEADFARDMFDIIGSKKNSTLHVNHSTQTPLGEHPGPFSDEYCSQHWERLFGVFSNDPQPRLVAYARLRRFGNIVACQDFIGHQTHLNSGVMKLLLSEIMRWLIDSGDPETREVDFFGLGTLEYANDGLFFWKKKALFTPWRVELEKSPMPEGWDPERYLQNNPDVLAAGADPVSHYLRHGKFENRSF